MLTIPLAIATTEIHEELHVEGVTEITHTINGQTIKSNIEGPADIEMSLEDEELNYEINAEKGEITTELEGEYEIQSETDDQEEFIIGTGFFKKTFTYIKNFMLKIGIKL